MDKICKECVYDYPHLECINCGSKHWHFKAKKENECEYCKGRTHPRYTINQPKFNYCPMCGRKLED